jgi:hypothetical protein
MRYSIASGLKIFAISYGDCLPLEQFSYAIVAFERTNCRLDAMVSAMLTHTCAHVRC